ncbi:hypothetical protein BDF21DRAFT_129011 [Thamnidium elegans]|nr:hypothetical protein BDF21DRAFT_129011 [Thamnidium elegans]
MNSYTSKYLLNNQMPKYLKKSFPMIWWCTRNSLNWRWWCKWWCTKKKRLTHLLDFYLELPYRHHPGTDLMSKHVLPDPSIVNPVVGTAVEKETKDNYTAWPTAVPTTIPTIIQAEIGST